MRDAMYVKRQIPIGEEEARELRRLIRDRRMRILRPPNGWVYVLIFVSPLLAMRLLAGSLDPSSPWFLFGILVGLGCAVYAFSTVAIAQDWREDIRRAESALSQGVATEIRIVSTRCFRLMVGAEEGSDYFFDVGEQGTVVVSDYSAPRGALPNSDFTIIQVFHDKGWLLSDNYRFEGTRLTPIVVLKAKAVASRKEYPHLEPIVGSLEERLAELHPSTI